MEDVSKPDVKTVQNYIPTSLSAIISVIRYFFDAALETSLSKRQYPSIQYDPTEITVFANEQIHLLLDTNIVRLRAFLLLDLNAGLRVGEMVHLTLNGKFSKILTAL